MSFYSLLIVLVENFSGLHFSKTFQACCILFNFRLKKKEKHFLKQSLGITETSLQEHYGSESEV